MLNSFLDRFPSIPDKENRDFARTLTAFKDERPARFKEEHAMTIIRNDPVPFGLPEHPLPGKPARAETSKPPGLDRPAPPPDTFLDGLRSLAEPLQTFAYSQRSVELHVQFQLKGAFALEDGTKVGFELAVEIDARMEKAQAAYAKNADPKAVEDYFSPGRTAARIVEFAKSFLGAYRTNHEGEEEPNVLKGFFELARAAVEKGFGAAKEALGSLYGDPAEMTRARVAELFDAAERELLGKAEPAPAPTADPAQGAAAKS